MFYVYKITNQITNKIYIGKTAKPQKRFTTHLWAAKTDNPEYKQYIHRSMNKYGIENFTLEIIEENSTEDFAFEREKFWIKEFKSNNSKFGYNLTEGGEGASGRILSEDVKTKMSLIALEGFKNGTRKPSLLGKNHSQEAKDKMSKIAKEKGFGFKGGSNHPNSILTEDIVKSIREEYKNITAPKLSIKYNVSIATIKSIVQFKSWKLVI